MTEKPRKKVIRHAINPFLANLHISTRKKGMKLERVDNKPTTNLVVDQGTGEVSGIHLVAYQEVDTEVFVKTFSGLVGASFDLSSAGRTAMDIMTWYMQTQGMGKDLIPLDKLVKEDFLRFFKKDTNAISTSTLGRGLAELEAAEIIAKSTRQGFYYINPNFIFNGDRIAFTKVFIKNNTIRPKGIKYEET